LVCQGTAISPVKDVSIACSGAITSSYPERFISLPVSAVKVSLPDCESHPSTGFCFELLDLPQSRVDFAPSSRIWGSHRTVVQVPADSTALSRVFVTSSSRFDFFLLPPALRLIEHLKPACSNAWIQESSVMVFLLGAI
jgi:hypothetical protein